MHISLCDDKGDIDRVRRPWKIVPVGHKIGKPEPLFKELVWYDCCITCLFVDSNLVKVCTWTQKDEEVESLRKKFAGSQADRKEREEAEAVKVVAQLKKTNISG